MKADVLSRKDQVNTKENNKNIKLLKNKLQTRRVTTEAEIVVIRRNQVVEETILLEEIRRNQTREQKVQKELEKNKGQAQEDNGIVYMDEKIYIPNNWKMQEKILQEI